MSVNHWGLKLGPSPETLATDASHIVLGNRSNDALDEVLLQRAARSRIWAAERQARRPNRAQRRRG